MKFADLWRKNVYITELNEWVILDVNSSLLTWNFQLNAKLNILNQILPYDNAEKKAVWQLGKW